MRRDDDDDTVVFFFSLRRQKTDLIDEIKVNKRKENTCYERTTHRHWLKLTYYNIEEFYYNGELIV